jgi:hypothetical protein
VCLEKIRRALLSGVAACQISESTLIWVIWPIFGCSTNLYNQIFRKMRFVVRDLLDGFFLNAEAEGFELLVRALEL